MGQRERRLPYIVMLTGTPVAWHVSAADERAAYNKVRRMIAGQPFKNWRLDCQRISAEKGATT